jgi:hypothetical protein
MFTSAVEVPVCAPCKKSYLGQDKRANTLFYKVAAVVFLIALGVFLWLANIAEPGTLHPREYFYGVVGSFVACFYSAWIVYWVFRPRGISLVVRSATFDAVGPASVRLYFWNAKVQSMFDELNPNLSRSHPFSNP